ncbi:hypothetical protein F5Y15DRAFT_414474 [Xylariaceae sp. FL0016]|nr:hypothetical protein F5Y15DRAFT_414474 [Xylariaceae sp. FL0016]
MVCFSVVAALTFATIATAMPGKVDRRASPIDNSQQHLFGNQNHSSFIGGQCVNDNDCKGAVLPNPTSCCAKLTIADTGEELGVCSGLQATDQAGKHGCGFVDPSFGGPSTTSLAVAAPTSNAPPLNTNEAGAEHVGDGDANNFIGEPCGSDADCASNCCSKGSRCANPGSGAKCGFTR